MAISTIMNIHLHVIHSWALITVIFPVVITLLTTIKSMADREGNSKSDDFFRFLSCFFFSSAKLKPSICPAKFFRMWRTTLLILYSISHIWDFDEPRTRYKNQSTRRVHESDNLRGSELLNVNKLFSSFRWKSTTNFFRIKASSKVLMTFPLKGKLFRRLRRLVRVKLLEAPTSLVQDLT